MIDPYSLSAPASQTDFSFSQWEKSARVAVMRLDPHERTAGPIPNFGTMVKGNLLGAQGAGNAYAPETPMAETKADIDVTRVTDDKEYTFEDVIDMVNPLQHLPVVGTLYRKFTGDTIKPFSNIIGGALFGGPVGAVASTVNVITKNRTGKDMAENAFSLVGVDMTPPRPAEITYDTRGMAHTAAAKNNMANTTHVSPQQAQEIVRANAAYAALEKRNFAAAVAPSYNWNS